jgi:hypothetical protein
MLRKAWRRLTAHLRQQGELRFSVHRHPMYQSFWHPTAMPGHPPGMQIQVYLEACNMGAAARWIMAAEIAGMTAKETVIGVRDAKTRKFARDNPLPSRLITTVCLHFLIEGLSHSTDEPFPTTLILTDHVGVQHVIKVTMH